MRKISVLLLLGICLLAGSTTASAQGLPPTYESGSSSGEGFQPNNIFVGGSLSLGLGSNYFNIGGNPEIGYSFSEWIDAGVAFNINYTRNKWKSSVDVTQKTLNYGAGVFARLYPFNGFFVQLQPEYNWSNTTITATNYSTEKYNTGAPSLLAGVGYSQRVVGENSFYVALLFDVNKDKNSPYRNWDGSFIPILRAGYNFYLHRNR